MLRNIQTKELTCFQNFLNSQYGAITLGELFVLDPVGNESFENRRKRINHKPLKLNQHSTGNKHVLSACCVRRKK